MKIMAITMTMTMKSKKVMSLNSKILNVNIGLKI